MAKTPHLCKTCKSYQPNEKFPGYRAGKCAKGIDFIATSAIFDVKEDQVCKKWTKKGK